MNISEVKELMDKFDHSSLREFSWKNAADELAFSKNEGHLFAETTAPVAVAAPELAHEVAPKAVAEVPESVAAAPASPASEAEGEVVKSPLVGVAYLKAAPEKPEFVTVGDKVKKGQTLLIIEAMKVMNEIPAPKDGEITEILVQAGDVVEFGQALVRIK